RVLYGLRRYRELLVELCDQVGLGDPERLHDTGRVAIDGVSVTLLYDDAVDEQRVFAFADLGLPHALTNEGELRRLLAWNLKLDVVRDGVFGIHPASGRAVLRYEMHLDVVPDGLALANELAGLAERAVRWRTRFEQANA
ncbi:MAG TPA: CesT family type III secretion system chaperone, partial [Burkholderiaceae bacterium]|nr:CesT family type III secretion system chaperone [Burkholderiaceae bacterium]